MEEEKRAFKRTPLTKSIRYQKKGAQVFSNTLGRDISEGGIGFISHEFLPISTELFFEYPYPNTQEIVNSFGEIMWISLQPHSERFYVGARFSKNPILN
ncbi:MAG: PilZ domain-containing protein [Candidatus Omnitrophota bacterium]